MNFLPRLRSALLVLFLFPCFRADDSANSDLELLGQVMDWVQSNGGWISEKLEVKQIAGALSGIFTNEPLSDGEMITAIPWELIIKPPSRGLGRCAKVERVRKATTKDPNEQNPYERYLAGRSPNHIPFFWSTTSKQLLSELMKDFHTNFFEEDLDEMVLGDCGTAKDTKYIQAMMLLQTRGEGEEIDLLVPFGDLMNHRNGNFTNAAPKIGRGHGYQIKTTREVKAGEEILISYNQCDFCEGLYSNPTNPEMFQVTPQIFEIYGFVESLPQRWVIPQFRMIFDIIEAEGEEDDFEVDYVVPPSWRGVSYLKHRLYELKKFEEKNVGRTDIPKDEFDGIFKFHAAVVNAYEKAIDNSAGLMSDSVWQLNRQSWQLDYYYNHADDDEL